MIRAVILVLAALEVIAMTKPEFLGGNEVAAYDRNELAKKHNEKWGDRKHVTRRKVKKVTPFLV